MPAVNTDPDFIIIIIVSIGIILLFITTVISLIYLSKKRFIQHQYEKQKIRQAFEQEKLKAEIEIQEQTFTFLSEELHDNIGQSLSLVKLNLNMGSPFQLQQAKNILTKSIQELRNIAQSLNTDSLKSKSLLDLITYEVIRLRQTLAYHIEFTATEKLDEYILPDQIIIFRIFQEAINNIIKHAHAGRILINLFLEDSHFILQIADDGIGFDTKISESGLGLSNMKKRAILIGADFKIISKPQKGCEILLSVKFTRPVFA